jgi:hypothetical protein
MIESMTVVVMPIRMSVIATAVITGTMLGPGRCISSPTGGAGVTTARVTDGPRAPIALTGPRSWVHLL